MTATALRREFLIVRVSDRRNRIGVGGGVEERNRMQAYEVGALVRAPDRPDWGVGQVQSVIRDKLGERVTVNFEGAGKLVIHPDHVELELVAPDRL